MLFLALVAFLKNLKVEGAISRHYADQWLASLRSSEEVRLAARRFIVCQGETCLVQPAARTIQAMARIVIGQIVSELHSQAAHQTELSELQEHAAVVSQEISMVDSTTQPEGRPEPATTQPAASRSLAHYV